MVVYMTPRISQSTLPFRHPEIENGRGGSREAQHLGDEDGDAAVRSRQPAYSRFASCAALGWCVVLLILRADVRSTIPIFGIVTANAGRLIWLELVRV